MPWDMPHLHQKVSASLYTCSAHPLSRATYQGLISVYVAASLLCP